MLRRIALITTVALFALAAAGSVTNATPPLSASFAPFEMTIVDWHTDSIDAAGITQTFSLRYYSAHDWVLTITDHSRDRRYIGTSWRFTGQTATSYDAFHGATAAYELQPGAVNVPNRWIVPGLISSLRWKGWAESASERGHVTFSRAETTTAHSSSHRVSTTVVFDAMSGLPQSVVSIVDDKVAERVAFRVRAMTPR